MSSSPEDSLSLARKGQLRGSYQVSLSRAMYCTYVYIQIRLEYPASYVSCIAIRRGCQGQHILMNLGCPLILYKKTRIVSGKGISDTPPANSTGMNLYDTEPGSENGDARKSTATTLEALACPIHQSAESDARTSRVSKSCRYIFP